MQNRAFLFHSHLNSLREGWNNSFRIKDPEPPSSQTAETNRSKGKSPKPPGIQMCTTSAFSRGHGSYNSSHGHKDNPTRAAHGWWDHSLLFSQQIKSLGDKSRQKNPNLSKSTPIQDIPGAAKWILGAIIKQLIIHSLAARKSHQVCGFKKEILPLKKKTILKTSWKNCAHFEVLFLGKQQTPRSWVGSADATMDFEHF